MDVSRKPVAMECSLLSPQTSHVSAVDDLIRRWTQPVGANTCLEETGPRVPSRLPSIERSPTTKRAYLCVRGNTSHDPSRWRVTGSASTRPGSRAKSPQVIVMIWKGPAMTTGLGHHDLLGAGQISTPASSSFGPGKTVGECPPSHGAG